MDETLAHKLFCIYSTNTHEYRGSIEKNVALFAYRSKVSHSCVPNTSYTSETSDGCLEYKTIRAIRQNESITNTYLDKIFQTPTYIRRQMLERSKSFVCHCVRCDRPDWSRALPCLKCKKGVVVCKGQRLEPGHAKPAEILVYSTFSLVSIWRRC